MSLKLVHSYVSDSVLAYQQCATALGVTSPTLDLFTLLRAGRKGEVIRRGECVTQSGARFKYHIHGSGYSFTELSSGVQTTFDVCVVGGTQCIRFTAWHLQQYASSFGQDLTREAVQTALGEPDVKHSQLIHVAETGFDYYCYPVPTSVN